MLALTVPPGLTRCHPILSSTPKPQLPQLPSRRLILHRIILLGDFREFTPHHGYFPWRQPRVNVHIPWLSKQDPGNSCPRGHQGLRDSSALPLTPAGSPWSHSPWREGSSSRAASSSTFIYRAQRREPGSTFPSPAQPEQALGGAPPNPSPASPGLLLGGFGPCSSGANTPLGGAMSPRLGGLCRMGHLSPRPLSIPGHLFPPFPRYLSPTLRV